MLNEAQCDTYNSYYFIILSPFSGKFATEGWQFEQDSRMGTFYFTRKIHDEEFCVYATPYFENVEGIGVEWHNFTTNDYQQLEVIKINKPTGNSYTDVSEYFREMEIILNQIYDQNTR